MPTYLLLLVTAPVAGLLIATLSVLAVERDRERFDRSGLAKIAGRPWVDPVVTGSVTRRKGRTSRPRAMASSALAH